VNEKVGFDGKPLVPITLKVCGTLAWPFWIMIWVPGAKASAASEPAA